MEYLKNKIAFGIPFKASGHTAALELCLCSIERFAVFPHEVFLQVDITNTELFKSFSERKLLEQFPFVKIKYYRRKRTGDYTQALVDWVIGQSDAAYAIFLHSDVFFYKIDIFNILLQPFIDDGGEAISCWEVPFTEYRSTFHISKEKHFYVAPRLCSWLFAVNIKEYKVLDVNQDLLWVGGYNVVNGHISQFPADEVDFIMWLSSFERYREMIDSGLNCLIDIGSFAKYYCDKGNIKIYSLGTEANPDFASMKLKYKDEGFVHIEQYDPERFDDNFYSSELMQIRTMELDDVLKQFFET